MLMPKAKPVFLDFVRHVVSGETDEVTRCLAATASFATMSSEVGATRQDASTYFFSEIAHYLYAGDTALHMAAAAFRRPVAELLVEHGANSGAKNRRGAEPLHYAADANHWDPMAQAETIDYLLSVGADANALDSNGVAPLHRAVRTRLPTRGMGPLLDGGAGTGALPNGAGSTRLCISPFRPQGAEGAVPNTHANSKRASSRCCFGKRASPTDKDGRGKQVLQAVTNEWIRALLTGI